MKEKKKTTKDLKLCKDFQVTVELRVTKEKYSLECISGVSTTVGKLKLLAEICSGIPSHIQRLLYLDEEELEDGHPLAFYDMISGARLGMKFWNQWNSLLGAVISGDIDIVMKLGVMPDTDFKSPISDCMSHDVRQKWLAERAFVALFVAAHRGHHQLCQQLIGAGANANATTPTGRTALHVAAAMGHSNVINCLLNGGAEISAKDGDGLTAVDIAKQFGHKGCERQLIRFAWSKRAKSSAPTDYPRFAHQYFDSSLKSYLHGEQAQMYCPQLLPPGEFEGTSLNAPRKKINSGVSRSTSENQTSIETTPEFIDTEKVTEDLQHDTGFVNKEAQTYAITLENKQTAKFGSKVDSFHDWLVNSETIMCQQNPAATVENTGSANRDPGDKLLTSRSYEIDYDMVETRLENGSTGIIQVVIAKKLKEQREKGISGLPYDLWLASKDNTELYLSVKDRGQLKSLMRF